MEKAYGEVNLEMLKEMSEAHGISGCEKEVSRIMKKYMEPYCDEILYDNLGSVIGEKKGKENGPRIMISSHMDEVGFMVRDIDDSGYIKLLPVGGWWGHVLPSQKLVITTRTGKRIKGVVGSRAPHGMPKEEKEKVIAPMDLFMDLGVASRQDVLDLGVAVGDMITPDVEFEVMNDPNYLLGKAWDDRIGCCVAVDVLKELDQTAHEASIYAAGTVQEEVGIRGARTATHLIHPDVAFALDVTTAKDTPMDHGTMALGKGVILSVQDASVIAHKGLLQKMKDICEELKLDINFDFMTAGGTDAGNIHKTYDGVITMTLSLPTRYMHSHRLVIHRKDYVQTVKAIAAFCKLLDDETLKELRSSVLK